MHAKLLVAALVASAAVVQAAPPIDAGRDSMSILRTAKEAARSRCRSTGVCGKFDTDAKEKSLKKQGPKTDRPNGVRKNLVTRCQNGFAGEYPCQGVDLLDQLTHSELGSGPTSAGGGEGSDCWGWVGPDGQEYGIVTQTDGTAFVRIAPNGQMTYLGRLNTQTVPSLWRDAKTVGNYVYIGSEATGHGVQVFDLRRLVAETGASPKVFKADAVYKHTDNFGSSHNLVAHEGRSDILIAVGQKPCAGGPYFIDIKNPLSPKYIGCSAIDGYTHDAQCFTYKGPDVAYKGRNICIGSNEDSLTFYDIQNPAAATIISKVGYNSSAYTHQGWLVGGVQGAQTHFVSDDELDELEGTLPDKRTRSYVWDIRSLKNPKLQSIHISPEESIDHNMYWRGGKMYQANYQSGLRIVDVTQVEAGGPTRQVGFFDTHPEKVDGVDFFGAWTAYPFPGSKHVLVNDIERGAFVLQDQ